MRNVYGVAVYRPRGYNRNGYAHLVFRFVLLGEGHMSTELFELKWQADNHGDSDYWYAGSFEISIKYLDDLATANRLAQRLFKDEELTPARVLEIVEERRDVFRVTYDSRLSQYVKDDEVDPAEWPTWKDTNNNCHVVAFDADQAKDRLQAKLEGAVSRWYMSEKAYGRWLANGRPVAELVRQGPGPNVYSDENAVALPVGVVW